MIIIKKSEDDTTLHLPLHKFSTFSALCVPLLKLPRFIKDLNHYLGEDASKFEEVTPELSQALKDKGFQVCPDCDKMLAEKIEKEKKAEKTA